MKTDGPTGSYHQQRRDTQKQFINNSYLEQW